LLNRAHRLATVTAAVTVAAAIAAAITAEVRKLQCLEPHVSANALALSD
jgi:hypothetical protein